MATVTLIPNGDGTCQWDTTGSAHYTEIDEGVTTPDITKYVSTDTYNETEEFTFQDSNDLHYASSFIVRAYAKLVDSEASAVVKVEYSENNGSTYTVAGYIIPSPYDTNFRYDLAAVTGLKMGYSSIKRFRIRVTFLEVYP
jgi:hypothetical protein